jgi:hypothetical protein
VSGFTGFIATWFHSHANPNGYIRLRPPSFVADWFIGNLRTLRLDLILQIELYILCALLFWDIFYKK